MKGVGILAVALTLFGCASGIDGFDQQVKFSSSPSGASVNVAVLEGSKPVTLPIDGSCMTPCSLSIARDRTYQATFTKAGCTSVEMRLYPTRDSRFFAPAFPDAWTGKTYDLKPDPMSATLTCETGA
jgi:hypothetical protein